MTQVFIGGRFRRSDHVTPVIEAAIGEPLGDGADGTYNLEIAAPFGGVKASGLGRELGPEGLATYRVLKPIYRTGPA